MPWIPRGLRYGVVTSDYPRTPDDYGPAFRGGVLVTPPSVVDDELRRTVDACPTRAIAVDHGHVALDRGACVLCGRCVQLLPTVFQFSSSVDVSTVGRQSLVVPSALEDDESLALLRGTLAKRVSVLRRSIHVRHLDAGSDGSDEWEIAALTNPVYDVQRLGIFFTASPRHADVLLVTGVGTAGMWGPLQETLVAMPNPKVVIAVGVDAISGGVFGEGYASRAGVTSSIAVDVFVPGSPATPFGVLHGILMAINLLTPRVAPRLSTELDRSTSKPAWEDS